jgi:hypothetical protein
VTSCSLVGRYHRSGEMCSFHLKTDATGTSETLVSNYQIVRGFSVYKSHEDADKQLRYFTSNGRMTDGLGRIRKEAFVISSIFGPGTPRRG